MIAFTGIWGSLRHARDGDMSQRLKVMPRCRSTCENVVRVLRMNKDSVMAMLEAFVHDPLINWRLLNTAEADADNALSTANTSETHMPGRFTLYSPAFRQYCLCLIPSCSVRQHSLLHDYCSLAAALPHGHYASTYVQQDVVTCTMPCKQQDNAHQVLSLNTLQLASQCVCE